MDDGSNAGVDSGSGAGAEQELIDEQGAPLAEEDNTDWKAIAEAERTKAENYKKALTQKRQLRNLPQEPVEEDDDRPLTRKDFKNLVREEVVPLVATSKEDSLLSSKIADPAKRSYIKLLLETRVVRTGTSEQDILDDIDAALAIADSKKKDRTISELARAVDNRPAAPAAAGGQADRGIEKKGYGWNKEQSRALEQKANALGLDAEKYKEEIWEARKTTFVNR